MRSLFVTRQFEKDLHTVPRDIRGRADNIIVLLRENPLTGAFDITQLKGFKPSVYRVRLGHYRIVYSFTKTSLTLHRFRHRKDIYRNF